MAKSVEGSKEYWTLRNFLFISCLASINRSFHRHLVFGKNNNILFSFNLDAGVTRKDEIKCWTNQRTMSSLLSFWQGNILSSFRMGWNLIPLPPVSNCLWTTSSISDTEYCRTVWNLFSTGKLVSKIKMKSAWQRFQGKRRFVNPGTGKSQMLRAGARWANRAMMTTRIGSVAARLTAAGHCNKIDCQIWQLLSHFENLYYKTWRVWQKMSDLVNFV